MSWRCSSLAYCTGTWHLLHTPFCWSSPPPPSPLSPCLLLPRLPQWSPDDRQLASGGNDNQLLIWSLGNNSPALKFTDHTAAVKVRQPLRRQPAPHPKTQPSPTFPSQHARNGLEYMLPAARSRSVVLAHTVCLLKLDPQPHPQAIAWSPHQHGLLASGGGTADRCIRFWNTANGTALQCVDTGSQVGRAQRV